MIWPILRFFMADDQKSYSNTRDFAKIGMPMSIFFYVPWATLAEFLRKLISLESQQNEIEIRTEL